MRQTEQETVLRYDPETATWIGWTDIAGQARGWKQCGWPVEVFGTGRDGRPRSWEARGVPQDRVIFRRIAKKV